MTFNLNLKFGQPSPQSSLLSFQVQLNKSETAVHYSFLSKEIDKYTLPPIVFQMPKSAKPFALPPAIAESLSDGQFAEETHENENFLYRIYANKTPEYVGLASKVEKIFKPITDLDNKLFVHIRLSDVDSFWQKITEKSADFFTTLFDNAEISAKIDLDKKLVETVGLLLDKISPGFSQSPIIAFLQLFGELDIQAEFDSPAALKEATRSELTQPIVILQVPQEDEKEELEKLHGLSEIKEPTTVFIHIGKLGYLKIQFQTRMLAFLQCVKL